MKVAVAHLLNLSDIPSLLGNQQTSCEQLQMLSTAIGHQPSEAGRPLGCISGDTEAAVG